MFPPVPLGRCPRRLVHGDVTDDQEGEDKQQDERIRMDSVDVSQEALGA